jgi:gliding motility-associated-like protein
MYLAFVPTAFAQIANFGKNLQKGHQAPKMVKQGHIDKTVRFIANKNQWDKDVLFRAEIPNGFAFLMENGFHYGLHEGWGGKDKVASTSPHANTPSIVKAHGVRVIFQNALKGVAQRIKTEDEFETRYNYYLGSDERKWATDVRAYNQVNYQNIYENIDLKVFGQYKTMKYEFHVAPNANPANIRLAYEGADKLQVRQDGFLEIGTSIGTIYEQKPYCYQIIRGEEVEVPAEFRLVGKELSFHFPQGYDKTAKLIIDPVLIFSTYSGSTADNWGSTATPDATGNLYSAGIVFGTGFPTTTGAFQTGFGGLNDIGILKFNTTGTSLMYSTYIGGNNREFPHSLIVDKDNNLLLFGTTGSSNYPTSQLAFDRIFNNGTSVTPVGGVDFSTGTDIILTKFNATGSTLLASTYIGGSGNDGVINTSLTTLHNYGDGFRGEVLVDTLGFVYVSTTTNSTNFPTKNAVKTALGGAQDAVVFKMRPNLSDFEWSTYLGGSAVDVAYSMKIDKDLNVYVTGGTKSTDLRNIVAGGAPNPMLSSLQGNDDGYVARFTPTGICSQITYVGTSGADQCFLIDLDLDGNVYVIGQTRGNYPISPTALYSVPNSGQFIHKISGNLETSLLSTRFGRNKGTNVTPDISPTAFLVNTCGNLYIMGWGSNTGESATPLSTFGLPTTPDAFRSTTDNNDFYIIIIEKDFKSLLYGSFFGGTSSADHVDGGTSRFDKRGIIYHAACASCGGFDDFPTTAGVVSSTNNSTNCNNGAFKFDIGSLIVDFNIRDLATNVVIQKACAFPVPSRISYEGAGVTKWTWWIDGVQVSTASTFTYNFPAAGDYTVKLVGENPASCQKSDTVTRIFRISAIEMLPMQNDTICVGQTAQLQVFINSTNPFTYSWTPTTGLDNPTIANPKASPTQTTTYTVTAKDNNDCEISKSVTVEVIPDPPFDVDILNSAGVEVSRGCVPAKLTLTYNFTFYQITEWVWEVEGLGVFPNQLTVNLDLPTAGTYKIKLKVKRLGRCPKEFEINKELEVIEFKVDAGTNQAICIGESVQLQATDTPTGNATSYTWTPATGLNNPNIPNPIASPTVSTTYRLLAKNADLCEARDSVRVDVTLIPILDFELELSSDCAKPTTVTFTNKSKHVGTHIWTITKDGTLIATFTDANPAPYNLTKAGKYKIILRGINGSCEETLEKEIDVEDNLSLPPNTITPNNDGKNDTFSIAPERIGYKVEIYNRWGTEMLKTDQYKDDWGKDIDAGNYYYILTSPKGVRCKGWINVIR